MTSSPVVVIGASTGGLSALLDIAATLPANFPAVVAVVLHIGAQHSLLPELLTQRGPNRAMHPRDGQTPEPGVIYVAPPDCHLLLSPDRIRLSRGPRENHARPAIDPLFRTAAMGWRERAVGVVLTGSLDDGTAGLAAIKDCGGIAVVQDPASAMDPSMPAHALAHVAVDHCVPLAQIPALLEKLVAAAGGIAGALPVPAHLMHEQAVFDGMDVINNLYAVGAPSGLTCPECGGGLWEVKQGSPLRYRCHTGHAYSARSLESSQTQEADQALVAGLRSLREREMLLRRLAAVSRATGDAHQADVGVQQADEARAQFDRMSKLIKRDVGGA